MYTTTPIQEAQLAHQKGTLVTKVMMGHEGRAEMGHPHENSSTSTRNETFGGYNCEFVEPPPNTFQTECPICHLILCDPYQVTCCGTSFCHTCIQRLQADNSPCPTCKEDKFEVLLKKDLNRSLKQLHVYCTHRKDDCQWRGELGELDHHMNAHKECPLTVFPVKLTLTNYEEMKRSNGEWYSPPFYTHPHGYKMCLRVDANGRGKGKGTHVSAIAYLMRGQFDDHLKWPFRGHVVIQLCNQLQDKYHRGHTFDFSETTDVRIISRVTSGERAEGGRGCDLIPHNDLNFNPTNNCQYLKNDCLHFQIVAVGSLSEPGMLPTERTMTSFEQHKIESDEWYSLPFYTHPQGYKMCLSVVANGYGEGKGTHVSVIAFLMRGEFDDYLKWPFRGHIVIQLCNQLQDKYHRGYTIDFSETTDADIISRVTSGERADSGFGCPTLIPHNDLNFNPTNNCQYLEKDCLHFQIVAVESLSEPGVLPTERTMTRFEQHKIDSNSGDWFSAPFYTHPQGYKMCLRVCANGYGEGKGTDVTVSASLMQGEFDEDLKWPFRGHVCFAMLNQLDDNNHTTRTMIFIDTIGNGVLGRVTEGERSLSGWGYHNFVAHTELNYNSTNNCQYLKYDCLRFRIVKVKLRLRTVSTPSSMTSFTSELSKELALSTSSLTAFASKLLVPLQCLEPSV